MAEEKEKTPEEIAAEEAKAAFEAALPAPGFKLAARITEPHLCPMVDGLKPHVGGPIIEGQPNVMIAGMPASRMGDKVTCASAPDVILAGCPTVMIAGKMAARILDQTVHGGAIIKGHVNVMIGS